MKELLEMLRELGVKSAGFSDGKLLHVEFWPEHTELPNEARPTLVPPPNDVPEPYRVAYRAMQGLKPDADS